jgi:hypothetical protein
MGLFKQMKDMKRTVEAAPAMIAQAQQLSAQAQQLGAAQQAAYGAPGTSPATMPTAPLAAATPGLAASPSAPEFEPIAGVSLELYAEISRDCAGHPGDVGHAALAAAGRGVAGDRWQAAMDGWNARMRNSAVALRFNQLYMQRG